MYDHDLRRWYRDLFLHSPRRQAAAKARANTAGPWGGAVPAAETAPPGHEPELLRNHDRPQATS
jgi:hypothetical protein